MRYLVISDIHSNLQAFEAVLADAPAYDRVWCLGDVVGYGPDPNECVARLQGLPHASLAGNHDWAVLGKLGLDSFNLDARSANAWTRAELTPASRDYLSELPVEAELDGFTAVHASPREPVWEYVVDTGVALANFDHFATPVCLLGHSHIPLAFILDKQCGRCRLTLPQPFSHLSLDSDSAMINPGSVGQPRDGDPRASYALLDTETMTWEFRRVQYDVQEVQERMRASDLPRRLIARLAFGR